MNTIDLRSDTVTKPTEAMREAMAAAEVGDDVYGEDPTINKLQEMAAALLGKEAGLLVPSGTMGNLASILAHCQRGDEVILGHLAHTFLFEAGGMAALGGIQSRQLRNQPDGTLDLDEIREAIRPDDPHFPITRMITLENTHNRCGGAALPPAYNEAVGAIAREHGLVFHLDGARFFNASVALGVAPAELAAPFDSITFCLSKGLSAPVGSVIVGTRAFIDKAHRARKILGGGMRQAGVLAAAGVVALESMVDRLAEDHRRAAMLAQKLAAIDGIVVEDVPVRTNMVYLSLDGPDGKAFRGRMKEAGVLFGKAGTNRYRMVTHCWITDEDIVRTAEAAAGAV